MCRKSMKLPQLFLYDLFSINAPVRNRLGQGRPWGTSPPYFSKWGDIISNVPPTFRKINMNKNLKFLGRHCKNLYFHSMRYNLKFQYLNSNS